MYTTAGLHCADSRILYAPCSGVHHCMVHTVSYCLHSAVLQWCTPLQDCTVHKVGSIMNPTLCTVQSCSAVHHCQCIDHPCIDSGVQHWRTALCIKYDQCTGSGVLHCTVSTSQSKLHTLAVVLGLCWLHVLCSISVPSPQMACMLFLINDKHTTRMYFRFNVHSSSLCVVACGHDSKPSLYYPI